MKNSNGRDGFAAGRSRGGATHFVATGKVKLRVTPDRAGHVLAKLPVNTPLTVLEADAIPHGWLAVRLSTEPPLFGYIAAAFLSSRPQDTNPQDATAPAKRHDTRRAAGNPVPAKYALRPFEPKEPMQPERVERKPLPPLAVRAPGKAKLLERLKRLYGPGATEAAAKRHDAQANPGRPPLLEAPNGAGDNPGEFFNGQGKRSWNVHNRVSGARHVISLKWQNSRLRFSVDEQSRGAETGGGSRGTRDFVFGPGKKSGRG